MAIQIQIRRDTVANWTSANPILADGEQGFETDTQKFKIGNGITTWNSLPYAASGETNTGANIGTGTGLYSGKSAAELQFKSISAAGGIQITSTADTVTISGVSEIDLGASSFLDLNDTPDEYTVGKHLISTQSGVEFVSSFIKYDLYVSPTYTGEYRNGSVITPFNSIAELAAYSYTTYTGVNDKVIVHLMPGEYYFDDTIYTQNPTTVALVGSDSKAVILKPTANIIGKTMIGTYVPVSIQNVTIDGTDIPAIRNTPGTVAYKVEDNSFEEISLYNVNIKGFYSGLEVSAGANVYMMASDVSEANTGITVSSGAVFDADISYVFNCDNVHVYAKDDAEVYLEGCEIYSWEQTASGIGIRAEGNAHVELFAGTNFWALDKNIHVQNNATVKVDNCILEETASHPGIDQLDNSTLVIVNSRAPLSVTDISIANPTNVYVNAVDSTNNRTVIGTGGDVEQTIFSFATGKANNPYLRYTPTHDGDHKAINFHNPTEEENTELYSSANNGKAAIGAYSIGTTAFNNSTRVDLTSIQDGSGYNGWSMSKEAGTTPQWKLRTKSGIDAIVANYTGSVRLNTGVDVNKILDEDNMVSNDVSALATQQSIRAFVEGWSYSSTALDSGQLDNRYYTEAEIDTISGSLDNNMLYRDGSRELTANWDAGNFTITADGFQKDNTKVDLATFANLTGLLTGGGLSINGSDNTLLDIEAGKSIYVSMADRDNPIVETLSWNAQTLDPTLSGVRSKWAGVYRVSPGVGGITFDTDFSQLEKRSIAVLGRFWGSGGATISTAKNYATPAYSFGKSMEDIAHATGSINIRGNVISSAGSNLLLNRSEGESLRFSANYDNDEISPNITTSTAATPITTYQYHLQGSTSTSGSSQIEPNYYDLNGVKTAVPVGKWTAQRVYYFPVSNTIHVVFDQDVHDSMTLAIDGIYDDNMVLNEDILQGSILRAYVIVQQGATALNNENQARVLTTYGKEGLTQGITSHGKLGGLLDDDHPQYHNDARGDLRYYTQTQVDELFATFSGGGATASGLDHGNLFGLTDDDHPQYSLANGTRDYTGIVGYSSHPTFTSTTDIVDKKYVDDSLSSFSPDHGGLAGLTDDDHTQYILVNGTRNFTAKISYNTHPAFVADTELVDKKYVDDSIPTVITDHGNLAGLSDDDHPQYLNLARGDARYYTETEVNNLLSAHYTADNHNGVYYTEAEVQALLATVSGALQNQLDSLGGATYLYAESNAISATTSTTFQTKVSLTFGSGVTGTYRLAYTIEYQASQSNKNVLVRLYNSTDALDLGGIDQQTNNSSNWFSHSGFIHVPTAGNNKTFQLQYAAGTSNCSVRNARLEARRVS